MLNKEQHSDYLASTLSERPTDTTAVERDAARYRWLRNLGSWPSQNDAARVTFFNEDGSLRFLSGEQLDKRIDAAMAVEK